MRNLALIAGKIAITRTLSGTGDFPQGTLYTQLIKGSEKIAHFMNIYVTYL